MSEGEFLNLQKDELRFPVPLIFPDISINYQINRHKMHEGIDQHFTQHANDNGYFLKMKINNMASFGSIFLPWSDPFNRRFCAQDGFKMKAMH